MRLPSVANTTDVNDLASVISPGAPPDGPDGRAVLEPPPSPSQPYSKNIKCKETMEITPQKIRQYRIAKHLTQRDLAARLGQHVSCVSGWELGKWGPTKKVLPALARMIVEWETGLLKAESEMNGLKRDLSITRKELKRYQVLCTKQERMIEQLLRSKESP